MKLFRIKKDTAGNLDDVRVKQAETADYATNAGHADSANNATHAGTADNATKAIAADTSSNVSATINFQKITDIFESDGLKVKKSTAATKLETARTVRTNLSSTNAASFDGTTNITPGVSGVLPLANGGIGATSLEGANIVTKNTQQTVTGQKIFSDYKLVVNDHADFRATEIDTNTSPTSEKYAYFNGKDKNGNMLGAIGFYQDTSGNTGAYIQANHANNWGGTIGIKTKNGSSDVIAYAPNPPNTSNANQIATTYWVNNKRPKINGLSSYDSSLNLYAPITVGTRGSFLVSNGASAPSWNRDYLSTRTTLYSSSSLSTGSKTLNQSVNNFSIIFISLRSVSNGEHYPFWVPRSEYQGRSNSNNKLSLASCEANTNRYVNMYYVSATSFYITSFSGVDTLEIWGIA